MLKILIKSRKELATIATNPDIIYITKMNSFEKMKSSCDNQLGERA
jgi:hypothetical protein